MNFYYSEGIQVAATLLLVLVAILMASSQKKITKMEAWVRFLLSSGKCAGVAVEGNASLCWMEANNAEHNIKGLVWLELRYPSTSEPLIWLAHDGINTATGLQTSGFIYWPPSWSWTVVKVKSNNSRKKARVLKVHFNEGNKNNITDVLLTFEIKHESDDGDLFSLAFRSMAGGVYHELTNMLFERK